MSAASFDEFQESIDVLSLEHQQYFRRAISNILSTEVAELTYAQILDGLPTKESLRDSYILQRHHPVLELDHTEICAGYLEKARDFRSSFSPSDLRFKPALLQAFESTTPTSKQFNLRLIELVVVACHQIAAHLYALDDGEHKHQIYKDWLDRARVAEENGEPYSGWPIPPTAFFHDRYIYPKQYPRGNADVTGYWAEGKIFGGVVVFDRGETGQECNEMWIHGALLRGPSTLYPPTKEQFDSLIAFLHSDHIKDAVCPLPIHGTSMNRPRWDPYQAIAQYHIFRDKYEREIPAERPSRHSTLTGLDWPEIADHMFLLRQTLGQESPNEEEVAAVQARLHWVTPSSPHWNPAWNK